MISSTSSSDEAMCGQGPIYLPPDGADQGLWLPPGGDLGRQRLLTDRTSLALLMFVFAGIAIGLLRTDTRFAGAPKWYWMEKLCWGADADVVVAGDSRVYRGIDPAAFQGAQSIARNFGFSSAKFTREYVEHAASLLSPKGQRVLVLGITPFSLCRVNGGNNGYQQAQRDLARLRLPVQLARAFEEWETLFQPVSVDAGFGRAGRVRALTNDYVQVFHENGWVESDRIVADPIASGVAIVRQDFPEGAAPSLDLQVLLNCVRSLDDRGVRVIGFRPPLPPDVAVLEDALGHLDYSELAEQFRMAGGSWVNVDWTGLRSYDGSHLDGVSAAELSKRLAEHITRERSQRRHGSSSD